MHVRQIFIVPWEAITQLEYFMAYGKEHLNPERPQLDE